MEASKILFTLSLIVVISGCQNKYSQKATEQLDSDEYYMEFVAISESEDDLNDTLKQEAKFLCNSNDFEYKSKMGQTYQDAQLPYVACRPNCLENRSVLMVKLTCKSENAYKISIAENSVLTNTSTSKAVLTDIIGSSHMTTDHAMNQVHLKYGDPQYVLVENDSLIHFVYTSPERFITFYRTNTLFGKLSAKYRILNEIPNDAKNKIGAI